MSPRRDRISAVLSGAAHCGPCSSRIHVNHLSLDFQEDPREKEVAPTPVFLPRGSHGEAPGGLQSTGSQRDNSATGHRHAGGFHQGGVSGVLWATSS